jgi:flagellar hook-basal body complex protein FliE
MSPLSAIPSYNPGLLPRLDPMPGKELAEIPTAMPGAMPTTGSDFSSLMGNLVSDVNAQSVNASQQVSALQSGQNVPLHQAVVSMEEASVSFQLLVEVRNRLLESYQEIMRMQM